MLNKRSRENLKGVHFLLERICIDVDKELAREGKGIVITYGVRTVKEQSDLFAKGRTKPGKIVTNCDGVIKRSKHQIAKNESFGRAIDFVPDSNNDDKLTTLEINDIEAYTHVAKKFLEVAKLHKVVLSCGAFWSKFPDYGHVEIVDFNV